MTSPCKPHKRDSIRARRANSLIVSAAIGAFFGVMVIGSHISEWSTSKSLLSILAAAAIGLMFGHIATYFRPPSKARSGNAETTNDSASIDSGSHYDGSGHSGGHDGGDCGGGD